MVSGAEHQAGACVQPQRGKQTFSRPVRLLKHPLFEAVYKQGQRHFSGLMTVFFLSRNREVVPSSNRQSRVTEGPRVGFTVSRALGGSVQRNRIRRRMREAVRLNLKHLSLPVDVVINPKKAMLTADFDGVLQEVERAFDAVRKRSLCSGPTQGSVRTK